MAEYTLETLGLHLSVAVYGSMLDYQPATVSFRLMSAAAEYMIYREKEVVAFAVAQSLATAPVDGGENLVVAYNPLDNPWVMQLSLTAVASEDFPTEEFMPILGQSLDPLSATLAGETFQRRVEEACFWLEKTSPHGGAATTALKSLEKDLQGKFGGLLFS